MSAMLVMSPTQVVAVLGESHFKLGRRQFYSVESRLSYQLIRALIRYRGCFGCLLLLTLLDSQYRGQMDLVLGTT
jgi:hypothetical protein